ncbi:choice-of-anchor I family protein [Oceanobacillus salinisoli]|uniref:choice-of-anchor I family protein n=1 Tax=Oceanobacillus salinisoli TaxID=2678611 RepID=UPI0012E156F7|nr:choice-of-anchor I family protein [Oceanobacillus salinisoli]
MKMKKKVFTGVAAATILLAGQPFNVLAEKPEIPKFEDKPPLFQYQNDDASQNLKVTQVAQYDSGVGEGGTEIMAYDAELQRAFITNGEEAAVDILSFRDLKSGKYTQVDSKQRVYLADFGIEEVDDITSIASHPTKDVIAISAVSDPKTDPGYIVFATKDGEYLTHNQVGALPDMVTFTPDGTKAIVANEGEPSEDYSVDPEGTISIIDITGNPAEYEVKTLNFDGVPLDENVRISSKGTTQQQLEPEYVAVSEDSKTAYVALQENNAIATVDLENEEILHVKGLGVKDHSLTGNELDAIDNNEMKIEKQPLLGYYMPDAVDTFQGADGRMYILTPNEGDARDYDGYSEEAKVRDIIDQIQLNADHYAGYTQEELDEAVENGLLERLGGTNITLENGQNEDGVYKSLHTYGARSFSMRKRWNSFLIVEVTSSKLLQKHCQSILTRIMMNSNLTAEAIRKDRNQKPLFMEKWRELHMHSLHSSGSAGSWFMTFPIQQNQNSPHSSRAGTLPKM